MIVVLQKNSMKPRVTVYIPWIKYIYLIYIYLLLSYNSCILDAHTRIRTHPHTLTHLQPHVNFHTISQRFFVYISSYFFDFRFIPFSELPDDCCYAKNSMKPRVVVCIPWIKYIYLIYIYIYIYIHIYIKWIGPQMNLALVFRLLLIQEIINSKHQIQIDLQIYSF